ncbi:MAG: hypothetical protein GF405_03170 [Candidatus Eisenbacteria bacterium]|nr:hypothetical protein [Candidatus Eisenbacteria bacterium]
MRRLCALLLVGLTLTSCGDVPPEQAERPDPAMEEWADAWDRRETVRQPEWAGGREVLRWPDGAGRDLPRAWAEERGLSGLTRAQLVEQFGAPDTTVVNESVGGVLVLYDTFGLIVYEGVCTGLVPRSAPFEEYFAQPDL